MVLIPPPTVKVVDKNRRGFKIMNVSDYEALPKTKRPKLFVEDAPQEATEE